MSYLKEHSAALLLVQKIIDWTVLSIACLVSFRLVFDSWALTTGYILALVCGLLFSFWIYPLCSLYRAWRGATRVEELRAFTFAWSVLFIFLAVAAIATKTTTDYSRVWFFLWFGLGWFFTLLLRMLLRSALANMRERGFNQRHIVVVGAGELGHQVAASLKASPCLGIQVHGFFSDLQTRYVPAFTSDVPILGKLDDVADYVQRYEIDQVWIAMGLKHMDKIEELIDNLSLTSVDIRFVPDVSGFKLINHSVTEIGGVPVINVSVTPMEGANRVIKAIEDRVLSLLILVLISPLMVLIAVGVKVSSSGPVFYKQQRVGWNGDTFDMLKFRSMSVDAEKNGIVWGGAQNKEAFPLGQVLRSTSLDELPQFINVLLGQMSIVGPRPERPQFVERFKHEIPGYMQKHMVKAGITGWAQINGWRGDTDLRKRIECDLYYIENWSIWFDLKILCLTVLRGGWHKNAY